MHRGSGLGGVGPWLWQSPAFQRLFGGVRSASQTEPHSHIMECPTPPPQKAEDSCCIPSNWQKSQSQPSAGTGKCHWAGTGLGPPPPPPSGYRGHTLAVGVTWDKQQLGHSRATPQHEPTHVPTPSWVPWGSGHCPWQSHQALGQQCQALSCHPGPG